MTDFNQQLHQHLHHIFSEKDKRKLAETFSRQGMVKIPNLVSDVFKNNVHQEIEVLLENYAERRDLILKTTDNTPRYLSVVRSELIIAHSQLLSAIRESETLLNFLGQIAQDKLLIDVQEDEKFVITRQEFSGDTHGWHWGDYAYALIWIVKMPSVECGGMLQCVPHTSWDKEQPNVYQYLCDNPIHTHSFLPGDIYLLKADTTLHRTVPLRYDATRIMLNMTWASIRDANKQSHLVDDRWWDNINAQAAQRVRAN